MSETRPPADGVEAEIRYPELVSSEHRAWLATKPFRGERRVTVRHLVDVGYVIDLLALEPGLSVAELGCGTGWLARFLARHGADVHGFDVSPGMIEIARAQSRAEGVRCAFEIADCCDLHVDRLFDRCVIYEALHHANPASGMVASARRLLRPGGTLLICEPNWFHRYRGRCAAEEFGTTERGRSVRQYRRLLRGAGFEDVRRFHSNRRRLYGNRPSDVLRHLAEPAAFRLAGPLWAQVWMTARAP